MAAMDNAYHMMSTGLRARVYIDYVPSEANMADLPSRGYFITQRMGAMRWRMEVATYRQLRRPLHAWRDAAAAAATWA